MVSPDKKENGNKQGGAGSVELNISVPAQYFNLLRITHARGEEFLFDLFQALPEPGSASLVGRYVTSVAHAKRIHDALGENIKKYESSFGPIAQPKTEDKTNGAE